MLMSFRAFCSHWKNQCSLRCHHHARHFQRFLRISNAKISIPVHGVILINRNNKTKLVLTLRDRRFRLLLPFFPFSLDFYFFTTQFQIPILRGYKIVVTTSTKQTSKLLASLQATTTTDNEVTTQQ